MYAAHSQKAFHYHTVETQEFNQMVLGTRAQEHGMACWKDGASQTTRRGQWNVVGKIIYKNLRCLSLTCLYSFLLESCLGNRERDKTGRGKIEGEWDAGREREKREMQLFCESSGLNVWSYRHGTWRRQHGNMVTFWKWGREWTGMPESSARSFGWLLIRAERNLL